MIREVALGEDKEDELRKKGLITIDRVTEIDFLEGEIVDIRFTPVSHPQSGSLRGKIVCFKRLSPIKVRVRIELIR